MAQNNEDGEGVSDTIHVSKRTAQLAITLIVTAVVSAISYPVINKVSPDVRYDSWTQTQDAAEMRAIEASISKIRDAIHEHKHKAPPLWVVERFKSLEYRIQQLEAK